MPRPDSSSLIELEVNSRVPGGVLHPARGFSLPSSDPKLLLKRGPLARKIRHFSVNGLVMSRSSAVQVPHDIAKLARGMEQRTATQAGR